MSARPTSELLYDSEAALRLVDSAIEDIRESDPARGPALIAHGYAEVVGIARGLRELRANLESAGGDAVTTDALSAAAAVLSQLEMRLDDLARTLDSAPFSR
jgi:hypothetical protein